MKNIYLKFGKKYFYEKKIYKGYYLTKVENGIVWSDGGGWLDCVFDNLETAKYFIDKKDDILKDFYKVIYDIQQIAIDINDGYVNIKIIDDYLNGI